MARLKLTKKAVEACPPADKDVILWDTELKGFGCRQQDASTFSTIEPGPACSVVRQLAPTVR